MQRDLSTTNGRFNEYLSVNSPLFNESDGYDYTSLYSSNFPQNANLNSPLFSPLTPISDDYASRYLFTEQQEELERRKLSLSHLRETVKETEALRQENINLQIANLELSKQFNKLLMLQSSSLENRQMLPPREYTNKAFSTDLYSRSLIDGFRGMRISEKPAIWEDEVSDESVETEDSENLDVNRVSLPKSISVRSNGYLKTAPAGGSTSKESGRVRVPSRIKPVKPAQRVYVRGGKEEEKPLELQVYNQGMTKTELCNKWQQTGVCPYGDNCQFAHGIEELRPVLRHPRYKTEVCRMVLNGESCPYGHRCHFRHSLTDQERLMAQQSNPRRLGL